MRDAIGAGLSAFNMLLFGILIPNLLGLPVLVASVLAVVALGFCVNSYLSYQKMTVELATVEESGQLLRRIAWLNLGYLVATVSIVIVLWGGLTVIGRLFLIVEGLVLLPLSLYEFWVAKAKIRQ